MHNAFSHFQTHTAQEQNEQFLYEEIMKANVICIVYSVEDELTIEKVS